MPAIITSHRRLLGGILGVAVLSYLNSADKLKGIYHATARLVSSQAAMGGRGVRSRGGPSISPPALVAWFDQQHPEAPICRIYSACFDDDGSRLVLPVHFLTQPRLAHLLRACGVDEHSNVLFSDNVLKGGTSPVDFLGPRTYSTDAVQFLGEVLPVMYMVDRLVATAQSSPSLSSASSSSSSLLSLATCVTAEGEECAPPPPPLSTHLPESHGASGGMREVDSSSSQWRHLRRRGLVVWAGLGEDSILAALGEAPPQAPWHHNILGMAARAMAVQKDEPPSSTVSAERRWRHQGDSTGPTSGEQGGGALQTLSSSSCVRSLLVSPLRLDQMGNGSFPTDSPIYRVSGVARERFPSCRIQVTVVMNDCLQNQDELRLAIGGRKQQEEGEEAEGEGGGGTSRHLKVPIRWARLEDATMHQQVTLMQQTDVLVMTRGGGAAGVSNSSTTSVLLSVAFLKRGSVVVEVLPVGVDPAPMQAMTRALDLKYHYVVAEPPPMPEMVPCNGDNTTFIRRYGELIAQWERRGKGEEREAAEASSWPRWDDKSNECITAWRPLVYNVKEAADRVIAEAHRLCVSA